MFYFQVTLAFSDKEVSPDSQTTLHVNAQPGSLCSVRSVDEGVMFLRPESDISSDAVRLACSNVYLLEFSL